MLDTTLYFYPFSNNLLYNNKAYQNIQTALNNDQRTKNTRAGYLEGSGNVIRCIVARRERVQGRKSGLLDP